MSFHMKKQILFCIYTIITIVKTISSIAAFEVTDKFIETGTYTLSQQYYYYGNGSWSSVEHAAFNVLFNRQHANGSQYHHSLQELHYKITPQFQINITVARCGFMNTYNIVCLYSNRIIYIRYIRLRYIVLDLPFEKVPFITIKARGTRLIISESSPYDANATLNYGINITGGVRAVCFFQGIDISSYDANRQFDLSVQCRVLSQILVNVKITTAVTRYIKFSGAYFAMVAYNQALASEWPFPAVSIQIEAFLGEGSSSPVYTDTQEITRNYNLFWGLIRFNVYGNSMFHFNSYYRQPIQVIGISDYPYINLDFAVMVFKFKWCDTPVPYYLSANTTCYDVCPARYYEENTQSVCNLCVPYDCYKCLANGTCTVCSNSTDFRVLSPAGRCVAMDGYFDDGTNNPLAKPCDPNCKTCVTSSNQCTSCFSGYFLNSSQKCQACTSLFVDNICKSIVLLPQKQEILFKIMITLIVLTAACIFILQFCYRRLKNKDNIIQQIDVDGQQSREALSN